MRVFASVSLLALPAWMSLAGAGLAGTIFEPVTPEGLSAERAANVVSFQQSLGASQLAAMEAAGYGAYGAIALPVTEVGEPVFAVKLETRAAAEAAALEACAAQHDTACTLIGVILPDG